MSGDFKPIRADITTLAVDAIVNAANPTLLGGGGVDGAIHAAAGQQLRAACRALDGCTAGAAKITPGFLLPATYVIHTVGPVWRGGGHDEARVLAQCYRNALLLAHQHALKSIAFPAISCGAYGYPNAAAVSIAVRTTADWLRQSDHALNILFVSVNETLHQLYADACHRYRP